MELTREGNSIAPFDSSIRIAITENVNSICADCKHVLDLCAKIGKKSETTGTGFKRIIQCNGCEKLEQKQ